MQATASDLAVFAEEGSTSAVAQNPAQGIDRQLPILAQVTSSIVGVEVEDRTLNMQVLAPHTMSDKKIWIAATAAFSDLLALLFCLLVCLVPMLVRLARWFFQILCFAVRHSLGNGQGDLAHLCKPDTAGLILDRGVTWALSSPGAQELQVFQFFCFFL